MDEQLAPILQQLRAGLEAIYGDRLGNINEEYGPTISRCSLARISRTLRRVSESGRAAAAAWVDTGDATVNCEWVIGERRS